MAMIGDYTEDFLRDQARQTIGKRAEGTSICSDEAVAAVPTFDLSEIEIGQELGKGGYCQVFEVKQVHVPGGTTPQEHDDDDDDDRRLQDRHFIATRYRRNKESRYAIKTLIKDIQDPTRFLGGVMDLATEVRFLSVIKHPNIIKMRAVASIDHYEAGFFVMLDRLYDTLADRLSAWKKKKNNMKGIYRVRDLKGDKKKQMMVDRLLVAHDIISAVKYLHSLNVVYRDMKPDNIGFDVRGDVKLFDLGLAKELDPREQAGDVYQMSTKTGSLRYMAPEVAKEEPYNLSVDIYSFGILLWQICSLKMPFEGFDVPKHAECVVEGGQRPELDPTWSVALSNLMSRCWAADMNERPTAEEALDILRSDVNPYLGESEVVALDASSRTADSL